MKIQRASLSSYHIRGLDQSISTNEYETPKSMSRSDAVTAVVSGELVLNDTTSMVSTPFSWDYVNDSHKKSRLQQVINIVSFISTRNMNCSYWRNRQKRQAKDIPANHRSINEVRLVVAHGVNSIGSRRLRETPHHQPVQVKTQIGAATTRPDLETSALQQDLEYQQLRCPLDSSTIKQV